jgi:hypothetical protein
VRNRLAQAEIDEGTRPRPTTAERKELVELRRQNRVLQMERDLLSRGRRLLSPATMCSVGARPEGGGDGDPRPGSSLALPVAAEKWLRIPLRWRARMPIAFMCELLGLSTSGFYEPGVRQEAVGLDHSEERAWRHLDSCGFVTWLRARPPRVDCLTHGVRQVPLPSAEPHSRFTALFERLAIEVLCETDISGACAILRTSWVCRLALLRPSR